MSRTLSSYSFAKSIAYDDVVVVGPEFLFVFGLRPKIKQLNSAWARKPTMRLDSIQTESDILC